MFNTDQNYHSVNKAWISPMKSLHLRNIKCVCIFFFICFKNVDSGSGSDG